MDFPLVAITDDSWISVDEDGLPSKCFLWLVLGLSWRLSSGESTGAYKPPLLLSAPVPVASSSSIQGSYQPPIALARSVEYRSPLGYQEKTPPQSYSVVYTPPETLRNPNYGGVPLQHQSNALPTSFHESVRSISRPDDAKSLPTSYQQQPSSGSIATSYSVQQQPASIERTYIQGSAPSQQTIHKAPASEIQSEKSPLAADRDNKKEEYVVYYYYYYDNDTAAGHSANNNLSLSFDDIPSLESYDQDVAKQAEPEKSANALSAEQKFDAPPLSSQGRSVSGSSDRLPTPDDSFIQPLRPVPNVFRYGSNEVPRFPVLPNFVVSQAAPPTETPPPPTSEAPQTNQPTFNGVDLDNELNNHVLDPRPNEELQTSTHSSTTTSVPETTTATTTDATTTEPTTTTERPRRRPPVGGGGRRRFNPSTSAAPRTRPTTPSTVSSSSSTTRATPSGRFQGNRVRSRPSSGFGRTRTSSTTAEEDGNSVSESSSSSAPAPSSSSTTPASRSRFTSQAPRRFQSNRSRSQSGSSSSTTSTTSTTRSPARARTTSRPRPNIISNRSRPPRPGFLRPRNPEPETTTAEPETTDAPEESLAVTPPGEDQEDTEPVEEDEEEEPETEAPPTTTEASRFSALFKPRNRGANRPRSPLLGNRPPRV